MEAINYVVDGKNMVLTEDAQIVQGVSGNGCYLPAGVGTIALAGNRNELSVSLWRQWDGVVESVAPRGVFSFKNIRVFFDSISDFLTVVINGFKAITDIKDDQKQAHWCFTFVKNDRFIIYKDAKEVYSLPAGDKPVDMADGFSIGGGRTHATFDEVRVYKTVLKQGEINGLFYLVSKGTQMKQLEKIVQSAAPKYLGVTQTVPPTRTVVITKGEKLGAQDANPGDWVLMAKTAGGWKVGVCYRWTGTLWANLEPEANYTEQYQACLLHICEIDELMKETGHFGALFAKVLVAQKALIDNLVAQEAFIKKLAADQAFLKELIVKRLKIDSDRNSDKDFEAWFDEDNGLKIKNEGNVIFRIAPDGSILMGNNIFFKHLPYWSAGRIFCSESETVKSFCERNGFNTFNVLGVYNGKEFNKIKTTKTEKHEMIYVGTYIRGLMDIRGFYKLKLKTLKYELILYFKNGETLTTYYKDYPDMPEDTGNTWYPYYKGYERKGFWSSDENDIYTPQQKNDRLNFNAYIGAKGMNYVMTIENIPTKKPNGSGIIWKDGEFLKIS